MPNAAIFLFMAAGAVALFAFLSVATWVGTQAHERKARDRFALLKAVAENPGENAQRVLEFLREEEAQAAARREHEERRSYLVGGLVCIATGIGLSIMFLALNAKGAWGVGVLVLLIGVVLAGVGASLRPSR